ncbi:DUF2007 domain-containing protein [Sphingomonas sp.]|uniref:putative signal transducing protein n=1 Tax=Sphingomonas sp. TaxID=28214 RepID=UPI0025FBFF46|nr:DUF2007 domain-containing protein [Sphingomonas sp.]
MSLVELRRFSSPVEGQIARTFLESHGFHVALFDAVSYGYADGLPLQVRLMVLDEELEEAAAALKAAGES